MSLRNDGKSRAFGQVGGGARPSGSGRGRLVRDFFEGRYSPEQFVELSELAAEYELDNNAVLQALAELQSLGIVSL